MLVEILLLIKAPARPFTTDFVASSNETIGKTGTAKKRIYPTSQAVPLSLSPMSAFYSIN